MVYYESVKVIINFSSLIKIIIHIIVRHYGFSDLIVTNRRLLFISKFWLLLYYFLSIKQKLSIAFYPQINSQTERQNSIIKAYLQVFINFEQNNWAQLLFIVKFAYNNDKNASTDHMFFKLNCDYHFCVFYKEDLDLCSKLKTIEKLFFKLWNFMVVY